MCNTNILCFKVLHSDNCYLDQSSILHIRPSFICLYSSIGNTELRRGGDTDEGGCDVGTFPVWFDAIGEGLDPGEVDNGVVVIDRDGR